MAELVLNDLVKIYPYTKIGGLFGARRRSVEALRQEKMNPYTTNEGVIAVQQFSLEIEHGEFVVLLGPSGCGKTTVLRMIAGLESVSAGQVCLDGKSINDVRPDERDIAMIFQNYALYPHLTVYDNIAYTLKNQHMPRDEIRLYVEEIASMLDLTGLLKRRPKELSGGQQQRVAIGRALVRKPKLFLLDEPFSNLDPSLRAQLRREVKRLHEKMGTTFIYVTHDQAEAFMLGTRIVAMRHGMIEQSGTPKALYNRPLNTYVASFVGVPPMNLLDAQLTRREKSWYVRVLRTEYPISEKQCAALADSDEGREIRLGIRPVHLLFGDKGIEAEVEYAETTGKEFVVHLQVGDTSVTLVLPGYTPPSKIAKHAKGRLEMQPEYFHLFDKESGKRI